MPVSTGHLLGLQQWMQASVMAEEPPTEAEAAARIRPSATLTPVERLGIYRGMYEARLIDALKVDDPGLLHYLGEAMFDELASLYVGANPSRSYSLNRLGDRLPGFLAEVDGLRRPAFVADLARLELGVRRAGVLRGGAAPSIRLRTTIGPGCDCIPFMRCG